MSAIVQQGFTFHQVIEQVSQSVNSAASARVYSSDLAAWARYCEAEQLNPFAFEHAAAWLSSSANTLATRRRQLSSLRKAAKLSAIAAKLSAPEYAPRLEALSALLQEMKAPAPAETTQTARERTKRALTPAEADRLLRLADDTPRAFRNRALFAVLLCAGLRRSEAAALTWDDIDMEGRILRIRHGKGDKARLAVLPEGLAYTALLQWRALVDAGRRYVFPALTKAGKLGPDKPMTGAALSKLAEQEAERLGVAFRMHDLRRTFITEALSTGAALADVQAQAGHANAATTLHYAQAQEASRRAFKLRYG